MKHMKQGFAAVLALVLVLALGVPALAANATWAQMTKGNSVLEAEEAYTPESVEKALTVYDQYNAAKTAQEKSAIYNNAFKPAIRGLEFRAHTFVDAPRGLWYTAALDYVGSTGKMNGVGQGMFDPQGTMTRGMAVTILWRMNGSPDVAKAANFNDVPAGEWYTDAVAWAVANKITNGKTADTFAPNDPVTREQMATFFSRMILALSGQSTELHINEAQTRAQLARQYSDAAQISSYAVGHVMICLEAEVMKGNADGTFAPQANITRAQGAQMLLNYYTVLLNKTFNDDI